MRINFSRLVILLGFATSLSSCLDHRLGGTLSPVPLRLKTLQSSTTGLTTYTYDNQNRLSAIIKSDGSLNILSYDEAGKKYIYFNEYTKATDQTTGRVTLYPYNLDGTSFTAYQYPIINSSPFYGITNATFVYGFDATKHLVRYYQTDGRDDATTQRGLASVTYAGEDIVSSTRYGGRASSPFFLYQYDTKISPLFGLLDPAIDPVQRFSRNNVVRSDLTGDVSNSFTYEYEYNSQNLPVKRTTRQVSNGAVTDVTIYSYESY